MMLEYTLLHMRNDWRIIFRYTKFFLYNVEFEVKEIIHKPFFFLYKNTPYIRTSAFIETFL